MGGVEDGQPPSKRMKSSLAESSRISTSSRAEEPVDTNSYRDLMARPIQCQGLEEVIGSKGVIKRIEFVRLIANSLYALGYKRSGECLEEESGISLHSSAVSLLIQHVLEGRWDESVSLLHKIGLEDEAIIKSAKFLILEQKFFELLSNGKTMDALKTLRAEISPLRINTSRIHELSFCILSCSQSQNGLHCKASLNVKLRSEVLDEVQKLLPPTVMAPERRLERLVEQALDLQRLSCIYHNSSDSNMSLYSDHHCGVENIPRHTLQILEGHHDEVWFLQFSNRGKYLASASNDRSAIIWEVGTDGEVSLKHRLCGHQRAVSQVAWSSDDQQLLTCGAEENVRRWDVETGECIQTYEKGGSLVVSCAWSPDGNSVFAGCSDKSICVWDVNGKEMECWRQKTLKISDLEITSGGKEIISMCRETAILILNRETKEEKLIEEDQAITSFSVSNDGKLVLVNLHNQEIHVWTIESSNIKLVAKYKGHKRSRFVIRSCFGGLEQSFIASGSEDSQVYIWHRSSGQLVGVLPGHSGVVNCVSWNPVNPHMLASASDDRTIRIWGLYGSNIKHRASHSNGIQLCNGKVC